MSDFKEKLKAKLSWDTRTDKQKKSVFYLMAGVVVLFIILILVF